MKRRIVATILLLIMVMSNTFSYAAPGDIIHTGLKRIYRADNPSDIERLTQDILDGVDSSKFYRELSNKRYINIVEEENRQMERLGEILGEKGISNPEDIQEYLVENHDEIREELDKITEKIATDFEDIDDEGKGDIEDYKYASNALILNKSHYSTPEPGMAEGTTRISTLNLPSGAVKWMIKIADEEVSNVVEDTELKDGTPYQRGNHIEIETGKYLVLYAVDSYNRIKGYVSIEITSDMIRQPKEEALKLEGGKVEAGSKYAGAIVLNELGDLPEDANKWQVLVSEDPMVVYKDDVFHNATDYEEGKEIIAANESELQNIDNSFKKYIVLLATDNDAKAIGYNVFEIQVDNISKAPTPLKETTNYIGPVKGNNDGNTMFTELHFGINPDENMATATNWIVFVSSEPIDVPALDFNMNGLENAKKISVDEDIEAKIGQYLLLAATDDAGLIKGYRIFNLQEDQVKEKIATMLPEESYSEPTAGSVQGTTKIDMLNLAGLNGATKWMYKVGRDLPAPALDKVLDGSLDYVEGQDIEASIGDRLLLLATDDEGRIKYYASIELSGNMIRNAPPALLKEGVHFIGPNKGSEEYTTKFSALSGSASIGEEPNWYYVLSDEEPKVPEYGEKLSGYEYKAGEEIKAEVGQYLMLIATDGEGFIRGYAIFQLTESNIRMPKAPDLVLDKHYSSPTKGTLPGTTMIATLNPIGIDDFYQWRYRVSSEKLTDAIELNSIIPNTTVYRIGNNIRAEAGDYLLLLATDIRGRVKAYTHEQIELGENHVRKPNANLLMPFTNFSDPEPGSIKNSSRFGFLDFSTNIEGATKWMYAIDSQSFGTIELDSVVDGAEDVQQGEDIEYVLPNDYLLLLATDGNGNVKGYREFKLTIDNVRGGNAKVLDDNNYELEKGTRPGTTRFSKLLPMGLEGNIRWKYKLIDDVLAEKPYMNSRIDDTAFVNVGQDIDVKEVGEGYGYILLLAVDNNGRTKGYTEIEIKSDIVKEHAPTLDVALEKGTVADSVKITGTLPEGTTAKYKTSNVVFPTPAVDEVLQNGVEYRLGDDIPKVRIGNYIGIYAVDENNNIKAFNSFEVTADDIQQGNATLSTTGSGIILEGNIHIGGSRINIELDERAFWAEDIKIDSIKRNALYNGFRASSETTEWNKVVDALIADGSGAIDVNGNTLTISLPETPDYDIAEDQDITLIIPAIALKDAVNPIEATDSITIKPTIKATISGDVVNSIVRESDIKAGGKTIVIELEDGDWVVDVDRDLLIGGFKVEEGVSNWDIIASKITNEDITRNSSKKITITLPSMTEEDNIDFGATKEVISLTIPKELVQGAELDIVASPTFTLYPDEIRVAGKVVDDTVELEAPDGRVPRDGLDTWVVEVTTGTLKDNITGSHINISGLPSGLRTTVEQLDENRIAIKVSGTASTMIKTATVNLVIKASAVEELNSADSEYISLKLKMSEPKDLTGVSYKLQYDEDVLNLYLTGVDNEIEYSINSTNGINGTWEAIDISEDKDDILVGKAEPITIWIREKAQPKVNHKAVELYQGDAPEDVTISEYNYDDSTVTLSGVDSSMKLEYSLDGGSSWTSIEGTEITVDIDENTDLKVREKAVDGKEGKLPSKATNKLNGIYLGNVELNVVEGRIENTTKNMEYSTNSGNDYTSARDSFTTVSFVKGTEVWIRERGNPVNNRSLGTVGQEEFTENELENIEDIILYSIKEESISLEVAEEGSEYSFGLDNLQYRIGNDQWKNVGDGTEVGFKAGTLQFRKKGTETKLPSAAVNRAEIAPPVPAPELSYDDTYHTIEKIGTDEGDSYEFRINEGSWTPGDVPVSFEAGHKIEIRIAATEDTLPSEIQTIVFTPNLDLSNVYLDVGKGLIVNTNANMEYSIDSSTGLDGQWYQCKSPNTEIPAKEGMVVYIREAEKPRNFRPLTEEPMKKRNLNNTIIEERIGYNIADKTIWIRTGKDLQWLQDAVDYLQYRNGNGNWINIEYIRLEADKDEFILSHNVQFEPGKLEFRLKGDMNLLPSASIVKATIKAKASAPIVDYSDGKDMVVSINGKGSNAWNVFEYSIDNGPWISGRYLANEDLSGDKVVRVRFKATDKELESQETVLYFTENLPLDHIRLDVYNHPFQLNGTTDNMQYKVFLNDGDKTGWINCKEGNTILPDRINFANIDKIVIREINQVDNTFTIELQLDHVRLDCFTHPLQIIATTDKMQCKAFLNDGDKTGWINCDNGYTELPDGVNMDNLKKVIIRHKDNLDNQFTVYEK